MECPKFLHTIIHPCELAKHQKIGISSHKENSEIIPTCAKPLYQETEVSIRISVQNKLVNLCVYVQSCASYNNDPKNVPPPPHPPLLTPHLHPSGLK